MLKIILIQITIYLAFAVDIPDEYTVTTNHPIADSVGELHIFNFANDYRGQYQETCIDEFGKYYSKIEPLSSGNMGTIYLAFSHDGAAKSILKAVEIDKKNVFTKMSQDLGFIKRIDEIKVGKHLNDRVINTRKSGAFMATLDWFQCNLKAILDRFCRHQFCPDTQNLVSHKIDTQFILLEYIPGISIFDSLFSETILPRHMTKFVRSITFQVLFAMQQAYNHAQMAHFDLHFNNIRLQKVNGDGSDFLTFQDGAKIWRVPLKDSHGYRARIIDYGMTKASIPAPNGGNTVIGPLFTRNFSLKQSLQVSLLMFFYSLVSSTHYWKLEAWKNHNADEFNSFVSVFNEAMGFRNMKKRFGILSGIRPISKPIRHPRHFGIPDILVGHSKETQMKVMLTRNSIAMTILNAVGVYPFDNNDVTPEKLLENPFYDPYRSTQ